MATITQLKTRTEVLLDDSVENQTAVDWFNQCQDEIIDILYLPTKTTLTKDVDGYFKVPDNYNGELIIESPSNIKHQIYDNIIDFVGYETIDAIEITYNRLPDELSVSTLTKVPSIPVRFHDLYVFYAAKMFCLMDEESERYTLFDREYSRRRAALKDYMNKARRKPKAWVVSR